MSSIKENETIKIKAAEQENHEKRVGISWLLYDKRFLALISLFIGFLLWAFVAIYQDPIQTKTIYGIPVSIDLESLTLSQNQITPLDWKGEKVNVVIQGNRMDLSQITQKDFTATAWISQVTEPGTYSLDIEIITGLTNITIDQNSLVPQQIVVEFDTLSRKEVELKTVLGQIKLPEDHIQGETIISPKKVIITGPETLIDKIDDVQVLTTEVPSELSDTFVTTGEVALFDAAGKKLETSDYQMDKTSATVTVPVYILKEIPLNVEFINMPEGFPIDTLGWEISHQSIWVSGPQKIVNSLEIIDIGPVDFKQLSTTYVDHFPITLRENIKDVENIGEIVFTLDTDDLASVELNTSDIRLVNVPKGYDISSDLATIKSVKIIGDKDEIAALSGTDFYARIDFSDRNVEEGKWAMPAQIVFARDKKVWAYGDYSVVVTVEEKA